MSLHHEVGDTRLQLNVTYNDTVRSLPVSVNSSAFPIASTSEEADQKIIRHTLHCIKSSYAYIEVHSVDSDVLILLLTYVAAELESCDGRQISLYFKLITNDPTWYNVISIIDNFGIDVCKALSFFHAFIGCDVVSSFNGRGKCSFFDAWMKYEKEHLTKIFIKLGNMPDSVDREDMIALESLVKHVYYGSVRNIENMPLNELRKNQFLASTTNDIRKIAPSSSALYMHSLRAAYTSGYQWVECLHNVTIPDPADWGYIWKNDMFVPKWLSAPFMFHLEDFISVCKCKTAKCSSCKCARLDVPCLPMCHCFRKCNRK